MYIIIHKYQRRSVNVETEEKYRKNKPKGKQKQLIKIQIMGQECC